MRRLFMHVDFKHTPFEKASYLLEQLEKAGYEAYFVGGSVRDTLLSLPIHDVDIASSATPDEVETVFNHTIDLGKEHGTILVMYEKEGYEITTFRTEGEYSDSRRPDQVFFVRNLKEDTLRRDFTINALAFDRKGQLYDYHNGQEDLQKKLIRAVGNPDQRFEEDALRMFRAVRFATQLGFEIEKETVKALKTLAPTIELISMERNRVEFSKYLTGKYFKSHYYYLVDSQLLTYLPFFDNGILLEEVFHSLAKDSAYYIENDAELTEEMAWCLLTIYMGLTIKQAKSFLKRWTHSNAFITTVVHLRLLYDHYQENKQWSNEIVYQYTKEELFLMEEYLNLTHQKESYTALLQKEQLPIQKRQDILINGKDIMELLNMTKGSALIGQLLNQVEQQILSLQLKNNPREIEQFILQKANHMKERKQSFD